MVSESDLLRLALMAYEAAVAPALWANFLTAYAETISADSAFLQVHDLSGHTSVILGSFGVASPLKQSYNEYYSKLNLWRERGSSLYVTGKVNLDQEQCPRAELERSEFYNDCLKRFGLIYSMGAVIARDGWLAPTLSGLRGPSKRAFDETERQVAQFLLPHLSRAWTIAKHLDMLAAGESAMDALPLGAVLVEPGGTAIYCNRAAEEMLRSNDGLSMRGGMLSAADRQTEERLAKLIRGALSPREANGAVAIAVPRPSLRREYQVTSAPLLGRSRPFTGVSSAIALAGC